MGFRCYTFYRQAINNKSCSAWHIALQNNVDNRIHPDQVLCVFKNVIIPRETVPGNRYALAMIMNIAEDKKGFFITITMRDGSVATYRPEPSDRPEAKKEYLEFYKARFSPASPAHELPEHISRQIFEELKKP